ncbi:unnamed protein product [Parascedosporium putredinis]|uniref:Translocation protein sec66 n=1 Tax=Parascedosporium putredinis TaxID=1442378 RepID=A0A9P1MBR8_9PEZI|nr:unnamed protein product [Parascedosporium putredinis]CAI7996773.1 unnamed protein product [Parascedosporium putredinis]
MWDQLFHADWVGMALALAYLLSVYVHHPIHSPLGQEPDCEFYPAKIASQAPWFGPHLQRDVYLSLQHMRSEGGTVPETVLRAALLRRATENINRVDKLRSAKTACGTLLQRGSVGEELFIRLQQTEKEMEEEIRDTVMEANALVPQWGNFIFQSAREIAANTLFRTKIGEIQARAETEKAWWAKHQISEESQAQKTKTRPLYFNPREKMRIDR